MRKLFTIALVLGLLLTLVGAVEAAAKSRTVRCDKGADLQEAIEQADSGDTITIKGVCRGYFVVDGKKLTLKGRGWVDGSLNRTDFDGDSSSWRNMESWQTGTAATAGEPARGSTHPN